MYQYPHNRLRDNRLRDNRLKNNKIYYKKLHGGGPRIPRPSKIAAAAKLVAAPAAATVAGVGTVVAAPIVGSVSGIYKTLKATPGALLGLVKTPYHAIRASIAKRKLTKRIGYNINSKQSKLNKFAASITALEERKQKQLKKEEEILKRGHLSQGQQQIQVDKYAARVKALNKKIEEKTKKGEAWAKRELLKQRLFKPKGKEKKSTKLEENQSLQSGQVNNKTFREKLQIAMNSNYSKKKRRV